MYPGLRNAGVKGTVYSSKQKSFALSIKRNMRMK